MSHPQENHADRKVDQPSPYLLWARTWQKKGRIQFNGAPAFAIGTEYVDLSREDIFGV
jgi:hypothetical protein